MTWNPPHVVMVALLLTGLLAGAGPTSAGDLPRSMAAVGDSITTVFIPGWDCLGECREASWSTGDDETVASHYLRLLHMGADIGRNNNFAVTGAKMEHLASQLEQVAKGTEYVTILIGANDACTPTIGAMTPIETFRAQFEDALGSFLQGPGAESRVFVASIPDIYHRWEVLHRDRWARFIWELSQTCQSMLSKNNTEQNRCTVRQRVIDYNGVLADVCAKFPQCRFDDWAIFDYRITPADVSPVDMFHPSRIGERALAEVTWQAGYWPW